MLLPIDHYEIVQLYQCIADNDCKDVYDDAKKVVSVITHPVHELVSGIEDIGEHVCDSIGGWLEHL